MINFIKKIYLNKINKHIFHDFNSYQNIIKSIKNIYKKDIDKYFENFIKIIILNKRLKIIPYILEIFIELHNKLKNIKIIDIISANTLKQDQIDLIIYTLEKHLLCNIKANLYIDKSLIAGIKLKIDNLIIDNSIKNKIILLNKYLKY